MGGREKKQRKGGRESLFGRGRRGGGGGGFIQRSCVNEVDAGAIARQRREGQRGGRW
jgi:hypothetical protein